MQMLTEQYVVIILIFIYKQSKQNRVEVNFNHGTVVGHATCAARQFEISTLLNLPQVAHRNNLLMMTFSKFTRCKWSGAYTTKRI